MAKNFIQHKIEGQEIKVLLSSDRHHDSITADHELEKKQLDWCLKNQVMIIDIGDSFDLCNGRGDPRRSKGNVRPEFATSDDYIDAVISAASDFYSPYSKQFIMLGRGNHEASIFKHTETDPLERLATEMSLKSGHRVKTGGYGGYIQFNFEYAGSKVPYLLKYYHGSGTSTGMMQARKMAAYYPDADIVCTGHSHDAWHQVLGMERIRSGKGKYEVYLAEQHHVRCGYYANDYGSGESGWVVESGHAPKPTVMGVLMTLNLTRPTIDGVQRWVIRPTFQMNPGV